jgi:hypothetical protein
LSSLRSTGLNTSNVALELGKAIVAHEANKGDPAWFHLYEVRS